MIGIWPYDETIFDGEFHAQDGVGNVAAHVTNVPAAGGNTPAPVAGNAPALAAPANARPPPVLAHAAVGNAPALVAGKCPCSCSSWRRSYCSPVNHPPPGHGDARPGLGNARPAAPGNVRPPTVPDDDPPALGITRPAVFDNDPTPYPSPAVPDNDCPALGTSRPAVRGNPVPGTICIAGFGNNLPSVPGNGLCVYDNGLSNTPSVDDLHFIFSEMSPI